MPLSPEVTLAPLEGVPDADLTALFNRVYADYYVPLRVDVTAMATMRHDFDLSPADSRFALRAGEPIGVALLGRRGDRAWIGGMGVVPEARRSGAGEALMRAVVDAARAGGAARVDLEVLEQNGPARALYGKLGFRTVRELEVWTLAPAGPRPSPPAAREAAADEAHAWIVSRRRAPEPWQRADATFARLAARGASVRAFAVGDDHGTYGAVIVRPRDELAVIVQLAARDEDVAGDLLDAVLAGGAGAPVRFLNVPASDPAARVLRARGATLEARQLEMTLALAK